jgi:hypothetical protein
MPAKIKDEKPKTLPAFLEIIEKYQAKSEETLWYRGCGTITYTLLPSLYRHKKIRTPEKLGELEQSLMTRFRQQSIPYHTRSLDDDWSTLYFMQHYGVPTRLLDWTRNPLIALHFALMTGPYSAQKKTVWILDPVQWNRHALSHQSYKGSTLTPGDEALKGYKPRNMFSAMNKFPVALYGEHNSPRIVAQQGVFTIFGQVVEPMEKMYVDENFPEESLIRITIEGSSVINKIRTSMLNHGITESVVYPDLEGLALEIKRSFGF